MTDLFKDRYRIPSARCTNWDYSSDGAYFITICTDRWDDFFGKIENKKVILYDAGRIAEHHWTELPKHFPFIRLDVFVIMPNHVHGILIIDKNVFHLNQTPSTGRPGSLSWNHIQTLPGNGKNEFMSRISPKKGSVSTIIRSFKSACTNTINKTHPGLNFKWQSRFHDYIIRDKKSHEQIRHYILNNPAKWNDDMFYR